MSQVRELTTLIRAVFGVVLDVGRLREGLVDAGRTLVSAYLVSFLCGLRYNVNVRLAGIQDFIEKESVPDEHTAATALSHFADKAAAGADGTVYADAFSGVHPNSCCVRMLLC